jgi:hypothetical protein
VSDNKYTLSQSDHNFSKTLESVEETDANGFYVVEISRSKNRVYILTVRMPDNLVKSVISGRRSVINIAVHKKAIA